MRSFKQKKFKSKRNGWSSTRDRPHRFIYNDIVHTFDGYDFKVGETKIDYLKVTKYPTIRPDDVFEVVSSVIKRSGTFAGVKNYMGYCSDEDSYYTFDEDQIEFI